MGSGVRHPSPWQVAALVTALALAWQWLIVQGYFEGQWSALFLTGSNLAGSNLAQAPAVQAESTYTPPNGDGYDGQWYHAIAHDPLDLHATDRFIDAPRLRYSRILLPALSYVLGLGRLFWIDRAYRFLELAFLFLGVLCSSTWSIARRQSAWWGGIFILLPGVFISLERQLVDLPACALLVAALFFHDRGQNRYCWLALACGGLTREIGFIAICGFVLAEMRARKLRHAAYWALAAIPGLMWIAYVFLFVPQTVGAPISLKVPILAIVAASGHLTRYPYGHATVLVLEVLDLAALAGLLWSYCLGFTSRSAGVLACVSLALTFFGFALSSLGIIDEYNNVYSFGRQDSPLLAVQLLQSLQTRNRRLLLPLLLMLPRSIIPNASMTWRSIVTLFRAL